MARDTYDDDAADLKGTEDEFLTNNPSDGGSLGRRVPVNPSELPDWAKSQPKYPSGESFSSSSLSPKGLITGAAGTAVLVKTVGSMIPHPVGKAAFTLFVIAAAVFFKFREK